MNRKVSSFTSIVKEEIITKPFTTRRKLALLAGFFKTNGRYIISNTGNRLELRSEYAKIAKFIYVALKDIYGIDPHFAYTKVRRFGTKTVYHVVIEMGVERILEDLNLAFVDNDSLREYLRNEDEIAGYLSGIFLATGSVNDPDSSNYHLEVSSDDEAFLEEVAKVIGRIRNLRFEPKLTKRRHQFVLYLKKSDQIADFLILIGATDATLEYENIRVSRDYANSDNRWQNCAIANMEKTIKAATRQIEDIKFLDQLVGIDNLPNVKMVHLARLRLDDESASLLELSNRLGDLLGKPVSRSNIAHVFRQIGELADRYRS